jgi:hypothetical protein
MNFMSMACWLDVGSIGGRWTLVFGLLEVGLLINIQQKGAGLPTSAQRIWNHYAPEFGDRAWHVSIGLISAHG